MLKRVEVNQLRIGMYCCSWVNTASFVKKAFFINYQDELDQIVNSGAQKVFIDTDKGLDVLTEPVLTPIAKRAVVTAGPKKPLVPKRHLAMNEQLKQASNIINRSKEAVSSMFNEARMGKAVNVENAKSLVEEITFSVMRSPDALLGLSRLKTKDDYTYMHSVAVCALMVSLAKQLDLPDGQTRELGLGGLLHDIGKIAMPLDILNKPGKLTEEEFVLAKDHPAVGHRILRDGGAVGDIVLDVCLHHHEKMNGMGYPDQLSGDKISMFARMCAVCDVYDAVTSNRPYKHSWCPSESLHIMAEWDGHFDIAIFHAFVKCIGIYPLGTLVRLKSGRLGVVIEQQTEKSLLLPKVRVFFSSKSNEYLMPQVLDLADTGTKDKIVAREDAEKWHLKDINKYWLGG